MAADRPPAEVMDRIVALSSRRVNGARFAGASVSQAAQNRIAVFLPDADADEIVHVRELLTMSGTLEFAIVANRRDHEYIVRAAQETPDTDLVVDGRVVAKWRPVVPEKDDDGRDVPNQDFDRNPDIAVRQMAGKPEGFQEVLVLYEADDARRITGQLLDRANPTHDSSGSPAVGFHFNQKGGYLFHELTSQYKPGRDDFHRQLAVILNDQLVTAPRINQPIGTDGIIESSRFTMENVEDLVSVLNTGAMPATLGPDPTSVSRLPSAPEYHLLHSRSGGLRRAALVSSTIAVVLLMAGGALFWLTRGTAPAADSFADEPRQNIES
jgi:preprotein translocase subunit SecD